MNNNNNQIEANAGEARPLKSYAAPHFGDDQSSIHCPDVGANNFELKPALLSAVGQHTFAGLAHEDPHQHITVFLGICKTIKINGVSDDAIRLRLFPFSLRDRAWSWLYSMPPNSITTWEQLSKAFLTKYFPPSKTANLRNQITNFRQREGETLSETWDRFKELLRVCPHHGLEKWLVVQTFYDGLTYTTRISIDAAAGGALMNRGVDAAYNLIEYMVG